MDEFWSVLGLEPTRDSAAIKRAYAEQTKLCHPEEDPEGFLVLRQAYQQALAYAEGGAPPEKPEAEEPAFRLPGEPGWSLTDRPPLLDEGPNPFADHEAARAFLALYTSKQNKDPKKWLDYFTSAPFLEAAWERRFAGFLLEQTVAREAELPIPRELVNWLCSVYQFTVRRSIYREEDGSQRTQFDVQIDPKAQFDGQEYLFELAVRAPAPKLSPRCLEQSLAWSFADYRALLQLANWAHWTETLLEKAGKILEFYVLENFQDRKPMPSQRHPAGMRLIDYFFQREDLPQELYRMAWQRLNLKTALMGRAKLLHGALRQRVLEKIPDIAENELDRAKLNREFEVFRWTVCVLEDTGDPADWAKAGAETQAFLARPEMQKALWDRKFAEDSMKYHVQWTGEHFAEALLAFYAQNETAPGALTLPDLIQASRRRAVIQRRNRQDSAAPPPEGRPSLRDRPFFRHWLNVGFYHAMDWETRLPLLDYLNQELPYLPEWSRRFLHVEDGGTPEPVSVTFPFGPDCVEVRFHLRYMSFLRNGQPVYRPCYHWEQLLEWAAGPEEFFLLLPITAAVQSQSQYQAVREEILSRLGATAAPQEDWETIAGCLADQVMGLPMPDAVVQEKDREPEWARHLPPESVLPFQVFAENTEVLYVCIWFERDQILALYQQTSFGKQPVSGFQFEEIEDAQTAEALAKQLLDQQLHPQGFPLDALATLPDEVYVQWDFKVVCHDEDPRPLWDKPTELRGEAVTPEALEELLEQFAQNRVARLEWSWRCGLPAGEVQAYEPLRSLVLLKYGRGYGCFYFDDFYAEDFALLERPEQYGKDRSRPQLVPFRRGKLFQQVIHRNFFTIRRHLRLIFSQVSQPNTVKFRAGGIWDYAVNVDHGRVKYHVDKQLLADFPPERACNLPGAPFYFNSYPSSAARTDEAGRLETLHLTEHNRAMLQELLAGFMGGGFRRLRLTWSRTNGENAHIVLLQDGGRFLMAWMQEAKRTVEFHVADCWTYMDVSGKKYPKDTFQGRVTPAYLIHDLPKLRNALDLLLANLGNPEVVTSPIGEYANEKPVKPRPYEVLWAELVEE